MSHVILIVDDDPDIRDALSLVLTTRGYRTAEAADGAEGMAALVASERPCLILLDLMMPNINGWEMCAALAKDPSLALIPVVILTGDARATSKGLNVAAFARKPIDLGTLLDLVERYCPPAA